MSKSMTIDVAELRTITDILLRHLEAANGTRISLERDYYWDIPANQRYLPYCKPSELTLGQLSDDLAETGKLLDGTTQPFNYQLVW
jgi:hypothetical protein